MSGKGDEYIFVINTWSEIDGLGCWYLQIGVKCVFVLIQVRFPFNNDFFHIKAFCAVRI